MLLLGYARHLTSGGTIDPPCTLPNLPRQTGKGRKSSRNGSNDNVSGVTRGQTQHYFLAPTRRHHHSPTASIRTLPRADRDADLNVKENNPSWSRSNNRRRQQQQRQQHEGDGKIKTPHYEEKLTSAGASASTWLSPIKDLCGDCWAMRVEDSTVADSKCQRCGKKHRRGFVRGSRKRDVGGNTASGDAGSAVGPVPWQQFTQVSHTYYC